MDDLKDNSLFGLGLPGSIYIYCICIFIRYTYYICLIGFRPVYIYIFAHPTES